MLGGMQSSTGAAPPTHCLSITQKGFTCFHIALLLNHGLFFLNITSVLGQHKANISPLMYLVQLLSFRSQLVIVCFHLKVEWFCCCCMAESHSLSQHHSHRASTGHHITKERRKTTHPRTNPTYFDSLSAKADGWWPRCPLL